MNKLSGKYSLLDGDVAEVADAADGEAGSFIYYQEEWIKFDKTDSVATVDNREELYALGQSSLSIGDMVRVTDYGDGKAADIVFDGDWFQTLNNYTVADMTELNEVSGRYLEYSGTATKVTVLDAGNGEAATFIYNQEDGTGETGEWRKSGTTHLLDDFRKPENLTIAQAGDIAQIGNGEPFIYTGKEWTTLNELPPVGDTAERNGLSSQTGDMVYVSKTAESYFYVESEWKKILKSGDSGMIDIVSDSVTLEGGSLSTSNAGQGCAGNIIFMGEKLEMNMKTGASVSSDSNSKGNGGDAGIITFIGESLALDDSSLSTSSAGTGDAGIITITADTVMLNGNSSLGTSASGSGNGGNVQIASGAVTFSGNENDPGISGIFTDANEKDVGNVFIEAEDVSFTNGSTILSETFGTGNAGDVFIHADNISFKNGASVGSEAFEQGEEGQETGKSGKITLLASESVDFSSGSRIFSHAPDQDAGRVLIEGATIRFTDESRISTDAWGSGKGGDIVILATGETSFSNASIFIGTGGTGNAGKLHIKTGDLSLENGAYIGAESLAEATGRGGDVNIEASGQIRISGSGSDDNGLNGIHSTSENTDEGAGDAGDILIIADKIRLENGGKIAASTEGPGNAGTITLNAAEIEASDASVSSETRSPDNGGDAGIIVISTSGSATLNNSTLETSTKGEGKAGAIDMIVSGLQLKNGASVSSKSESQDNGGHAGKVTIIASDSVELDNSSLETSSAGKGNAGAINLIVSGLRLENEASVSSKSTSEGTGGHAGTITVNAGESVTLRTKSSIKTSSAGQGNAGAINLIIADRLHLDTDTSVSSDSESQGKGGNAGTITIIAGELKGDEKTSVSTSSAGEGNAGAINLIITNLQVGNGASVSSASRSERKGGDAGTITIVASDSIKLHGTGSLTTDARDAGGGDITTDSESLILNHGNITANAKEGDGGGHIHPHRKLYQIVGQQSDGHVRKGK